MSAGEPPQLPLTNAYWVIPGKLAAGEYPISKYLDDKTRTILGGLLDAGIRCFVNLTQPGELPPYSAILQEQSDWRGVSAKIHSFPISDFSTPTTNQMNDILTLIQDSLATGEGVYVHCRAGIGRTGGVVGCYLVHQGLTGEQALAEIAALRRGLPNAWMTSPESEAQQEMVLNWHQQAPQKPLPGSVHHP